MNCFQYKWEILKNRSSRPLLKLNSDCVWVPLSSLDRVESGIILAIALAS
jgi:hypothetical protein